VVATLLRGREGWSGAGQRNEAPELGGLLNGIRVARPGGAGRPRKRPPARQPGLRPRELRDSVEEAGRPTRHPRAQGPARAPPSGMPAGVRPRGLPQAQRGGALREPPRAVAQGGDEVREAAVYYRTMVIIAPPMIWLPA
jgi:hypothetical protein